MAEQEVKSEKAKVLLVKKIYERCENLQHDINKAEDMGIKVELHVGCDRDFAGQAHHRIQVDCWDSHLMEKALKPDN